MRTISAAWLSMLPLVAVPSFATGNFSIPYLNYYCNAAHVSSTSWTPPPRPHGFDESSSLQLVHVTALLRHHKRTPANLIPLENQFNPPGTRFSCVGSVLNA